MKNNTFWLIEILIWVILIGGLIFIGINFGEDYLSGRKTYNVVFKDVDGLIVGSPVRMMGIQVGHVTRINPSRDRVNITFVLTDKRVKIPAYSDINIQFTGLAGSKSLEVQPTKFHKSGGEFFNVAEPIRIVSLLNVQADITKSVLDVSRIGLSILGHGGVEEFRTNIKKSTIVTKDMYNNLNDASNVLTSSKTAILSDSQEIKKFLEEESYDIGYINDEEFKYPLENKHETISVLNNVHEASKLFENDDFDNYADRIAIKLQKMNHNVSKVHKDINSIKTKNPDYLEDIHNSFNGFISGCNNVSKFIGSGLNKDNIYKVRMLTKKLNNQEENK